jgi:hypothetical protein
MRASTYGYATPGDKRALRLRRTPAMDRWSEFMQPTQATASPSVSATPPAKKPAGLGAPKTALIVVLVVAMGVGLFALINSFVPYGAKMSTMQQIGMFALPLMAATAFGKWLEKKLTRRK